MSYLSDFEELNGGYVSFGGNPKGGKISSKGKIRIGKLDFDDVYFVKELKFNLFSVSQMSDKKNSVLFTDIECLVLSPDFKLPDASQGKQHRASCKTKSVSSIDQSLYRLHMDLFGPTFVRSLNKKSYCLVITDDYNRTNTNGDATFNKKKPDSEVIVSPRSSAQSRKQDDKNKREAKGKSHVESFTGYRDLNVEFEDCSDNSINEDNAAGSIVPTVGQISPNNTNTFSAVGPSNAAASPTHEKSSLDASQLLDDPDMP
nr:ribonuclease H-like domain-containing protein [Tanacetum cinerariifolium]